MAIRVETIISFGAGLFLAVAAVAHAEVSIDAEGGVIKGTSTGIHFDAKAELLYSDTEVLRSKVSFNDILVDCQPVDGGAVCADPVSGGYGFRDDAEGYYLHEDFFSAAKDAYFEPNLIKWLPADMGAPYAEVVVAVRAEAERRAFAGWRLYRGDLISLAIRLAAEKDTPSLWRVGTPQFGINTLTRPRQFDQYDTDVQANFPKTLPADSLRSRLEKHCGLSPSSVSTITGGSGLRDQLRAFLKARLDHREQFVARMNARLAKNSSSGKQINWKRSPIESGWMQFLDQLGEWYVLVQESNGRASALAVVNFRQVGTTTQLDWITASLHTATPQTMEGLPGWSYGSEAYANYANVENLYRLAYSNVCAEAQQ